MLCCSEFQQQQWLKSIAIKRILNVPSPVYSTLKMTYVKLSSTWKLSQKLSFSIESGQGMFWWQNGDISVLQKSGQLFHQQFWKREVIGWPSKMWHITTWLKRKNSESDNDISAYRLTNYTARLLWPTIQYPITKLLHLYLYRSNRSNSTTPVLQYLWYYHVVPTQLLCWSTCVGTPR